MYLFSAAVVAFQSLSVLDASQHLSSFDSRLLLYLAIVLALFVAAQVMLARCTRFVLFCLLAGAACAAQQHTRPDNPAAPQHYPAVAIPQLGEEVPAGLVKRGASTKPCDIGDGKTDPCATVTTGHNRVTVAWDATSRRVTYLYSTTLDTDSDIRLGDLLAIDPDSPITPFPAPSSPHRFVTVDWCDTDRNLTGEALWCAVMLPMRPRSGKVVGFVQSLYLYLPEWDPEPMHRTGFGAAR